MSVSSELTAVVQALDRVQALLVDRYHGRMFPHGLAADIERVRSLVLDLRHRADSLELRR